MPIQTHSNESENQTVTAKDISDPNISFTDYERLRREGAKIDSGEKPAPEAKKPLEQKQASESDTDEKEAKEEKDEQTEYESDEEEEKEDEKNEEKPRKKGGFQRRIDKLNARYSEERSKREALETKLAELEKVGKPDSKKVDSKDDGKPDPNDFDSHTEYVEALTEWKLDQREKQTKAKDERSQLESEMKERMKAHSERISAFKEKTEDYDDVVESADIAFSAAAAEVITSSEFGPEMIYELAKNRKEAERIAGLPPLAAARELGKLEAKFALKASEQKKPEQKTITKAPKPIEPISGGKTGVSRSIYDKDISFEDYERLRREQLRRK